MQVKEKKVIQFKGYSIECFGYKIETEDCGYCKKYITALSEVLLH